MARLGRPGSGKEVRSGLLRWAQPTAKLRLIKKKILPPVFRQISSKITIN
jgi:hypothetical protein